MKHGYGCPYHYGPINYGPPGGDDDGEDCECEVCAETPFPAVPLETIEKGLGPDREFFVIETKTYLAPVKLRWRTRFRLWRFHRRLRKIGMMELERDFARALDEALLYGDLDEWSPYHEFRKTTDPPPWGEGRDEEER